MRGMAGRGALALAAIGLGSTLSTYCADGADAAYRRDIEQWRQKREERLKADEGWLTVAGLFWLHEGENSFGADPSSEIVLPPGSAPGRAGVFVHEGGRTTVRLAEGTTATVEGKPVTSIEMHPDTSGEPDVLAINDLTMYVIQRGDRFGIRMRDRNSRFRRDFTGLHWFPVDEAWRVTARFVPYDPPKQIPIPTVLNTVENMPSPGYVVFSVGGQEVRLDPVLESPDDTSLFFIFKDATSGKETYPPGRFLYTDLPKDGAVVLDFNKTYNPPCAFTPFATCPLPPEQNRLPIRIEAGELRYGDH